ncbi:hypothetical protein TIFTF001_020129 [Ficus carica]|uniref:Uncharacterized protein n=1 Tax=Ficus carica TaxID=3494 RepID=A0AA88DAQ8_FICCA|nr:hypothetical protein TIFTF001_020129 [Ficus carica]
MSVARRTPHHGWTRSLIILPRHGYRRTERKLEELRTPRQGGPNAGHRLELDLGQFQENPKPTIKGVRAGPSTRSAQADPILLRTVNKVCSGRPFTPKVLGPRRKVSMLVNSKKDPSQSMEVLKHHPPQSTQANHTQQKMNKIRGQSGRGGQHGRKGQSGRHEPLARQG